MHRRTLAGVPTPPADSAGQTRDAAEPASPGRPRGLRLAAVVVLVEGLALLGFGGWLVFELATRDPSNRDVATGSSVYFVVLGLLVVLVAWGLWRRSGWSHGAAVFLQLLALPVAFSMAQAGAWWGAALLGVLAIVTVIGLLKRDTRVALGRD